jgi:uncharacterized protein YxeA
METEDILKYMAVIGIVLISAILGTIVWNKTDLGFHNLYICDNSKHSCRYLQSTNSLKHCVETTALYQDQIDRKTEEFICVNAKQLREVKTDGVQ